MNAAHINDKLLSDLNFLKSCTPYNYPAFVRRWTNRDCDAELVASCLVGFLAYDLFLHRTGVWSEAIRNSINDILVNSSLHEILEFRDDKLSYKPNVSGAVKEEISFLLDDRSGVIT